MSLRVAVIAFFIIIFPVALVFIFVFFLFLIWLFSRNNIESYREVKKV